MARWLIAVSAPPAVMQTAADSEQQRDDGERECCESAPRGGGAGSFDVCCGTHPLIVRAASL
ncbi:hypothetical protein [Frankia sp. EAN1pec]|uniref:hypothetical protein n=1 Tax=Parafrankia sp. (strain EAN1pec) TaxID=298653 RepID=UPI0018DCD9BF